jgi:microcystin-dependent protein
MEFIRRVAEGIVMSESFIGEIRLFAFPRIPNGWLACDGSSLQISNYQPLYTVIGTTYGGDGITTFNVPDLRGRVPIHEGQGQGLPPYILGQIGGEDQHTLINNELPVHSHGLTSSSSTTTTPTPGNTVHLGTASAGLLYAPSGNAPPYEVMAPCVMPTGNSQGHNNIMPTLVGNYCICNDGIFPS